MAKNEQAVIEVRIQMSGGSGETEHLMTWPSDRLGEVIPLLTSWTINGEQPELAGQFVIESGGGYFLVMAFDGDEA